jgi:hypothetical protein
MKSFISNICFAVEHAISSYDMRRSQAYMLCLKNSNIHNPCTVHIRPQSYLKCLQMSQETGCLYPRERGSLFPIHNFAGTLNMQLGQEYRFFVRNLIRQQKPFTLPEKHILENMGREMLALRTEESEVILGFFLDHARGYRHKIQVQLSRYFHRESRMPPDPHNLGIC